MAPYWYGRSYWCVKVTKDISQDGEIYVNANKAIVTEAGALEFWGSFENDTHPEGPEQVYLAIAPGKWLAYYGASCLRGHPVAVEYWAGEIINPYEQPTSSGKSNAKRERQKMSKSLRYDVLKRDNFHCAICGASGKQENLVVDHITPVSKGGKTVMDNLQTLCNPCNEGKSDKV